MVERDYKWNFVEENLVEVHEYIFYKTGPDAIFSKTSKTLNNAQSQAFQADLAEVDNPYGIDGRLIASLWFYEITNDLEHVFLDN